MAVLSRMLMPIFEGAAWTVENVTASSITTMAKRTIPDFIISSCYDLKR
jgi:hypothetical protein